MNDNISWRLSCLLHVASEEVSIITLGSEPYFSLDFYVEDMYRE